MSWLPCTSSCCPADSVPARPPRRHRRGMARGRVASLTFIVAHVHLNFGSVLTIHAGRLPHYRPLKRDLETSTLTLLRRAVTVVEWATAKIEPRRRSACHRGTARLGRVRSATGDHRPKYDDGRIVLRAHGNPLDGVPEDTSPPGERTTRTPLRATSPRPTSRLTPCEIALIPKQPLLS